MHWHNLENQKSRTFTCGYCGTSLASERGWRATLSAGNAHAKGFIYICHSCVRPTFFDEVGRQTPGISFGKPVQNVTDAALNAIYEEARLATSAGCFTAAVLCCRKLLMHLAVAKGADPGETFKSYVEYLAKNNHIPASCKSWVDEIRDTGNEANHEIKMMKREDAEHLVSFCEMLLKISYEFPAVALARNGAKVAA